MKLLEKIYSKTDSTIKYIFLMGELISEVSYINKNDGKDIICVPCQTSCSMGCKFCHITDIKDKLQNKNLKYDAIHKMVNYVYSDLSLGKNQNILLVSYMGLGEPMLNWQNVVDSMKLLKTTATVNYKKAIRFGLATSLPASNWINFYKFADKVKKSGLDVKVHLSLHYTEDYTRRKWMDKSLNIAESMKSLEFYKKHTGNAVEVHYALINGVNDSLDDADRLIYYVKKERIPVKFLFFNEKENSEYHPSRDYKVKKFTDELDEFNLEYEYYTPPGLDIGASCGQFLLDYYVKYNSNNIK